MAETGVSKRKYVEALVALEIDRLTSDWSDQKESDRIAELDDLYFQLTPEEQAEVEAVPAPKFGDTGMVDVEVKIGESIPPRRMR